jgi:hypothetical protein
VKLEFDQKDIQELLFKKAKEMGIEVNAMIIDSSYGNLRSISVHFDETKDAPADVSTIQRAA